MTHQAEIIDSPDESFSKLNMLDFISSKEIEKKISKSHTKKIPYDLYIRLSPQKFVRIVNRNQEIPVEQFKNYYEKGALFVYMKKEDFQNYLGINLSLT
ncbi:MAG: hypothetical protein HY072_10310, partial [Deltaproteobacteria bacterium]|nr:hypothetical protein [Deltaproteobacteria bacterium]